MVCMTQRDDHGELIRTATTDHDDKLITCNWKTKRHYRRALSQTNIFFPNAMFDQPNPPWLQPLLFIATAHFFSFRYTKPGYLTCLICMFLRYSQCVLNKTWLPCQNRWLSGFSKPVRYNRYHQGIGNNPLMAGLPRGWLWFLVLWLHFNLKPHQFGCDQQPYVQVIERSTHSVDREASYESDFLHRSSY